MLWYGRDKKLDGHAHHDIRRGNTDFSHYSNYGIYIIMFTVVFQSRMGSDYDLERIIDDWILMGFLVGNDFIPHLPHLHINHDALPLLYKTYISVLPSLGGETHTHTHTCTTFYDTYFVHAKMLEWFSRIVLLVSISVCSSARGRANCLHLPLYHNIFCFCKVQKRIETESSFLT